MQGQKSRKPVEEQNYTRTNEPKLPKAILQPYHNLPPPNCPFSSPLAISPHPLLPPNLLNHQSPKAIPSSELPLASANSPLLRRNPHGASYVQKTGQDVCLLPPVEEQGRTGGGPEHHSTAWRHPHPPCLLPFFRLALVPGDGDNTL